MPGEGMQFGFMQYSDRIHVELELGAAKSLREYISVLQNMTFQNGDYNDISGALEAAVDMLQTQ